MPTGMEERADLSETNRKARTFGYLTDYQYISLLVTASGNPGPLRATPAAGVAGDRAQRSSDRRPRPTRVSPSVPGATGVSRSTPHRRR